MKIIEKISIILLLIVMFFQCSIYAAYPVIDSYKVIDPQKKGSITIYVLEDRHGNVITSKGTGLVQDIPEGALPLADIFFDVYLVGDDETVTTVPDSEVLYTGHTDSEGMVQFTDLKVGRYLVVPTKYPSNVDIEIGNFLVDVPSLNAADAIWNYDVIVYPKVQTIYGSVVLTVSDGNEKAPLANTVWELYKKNEDGEYEKYTNVEYITLKEYTTNANGQICIDNLPHGDYRLVQKEVPYGIGLNTTVVPFTIDKTSYVTGSAQDGWVASEAELNIGFVDYIIPTSERYEFHKELEGEISGGQKLDDTQHWTISAAIPVDVENFTRFLVTDQIDEMIELDLDSIAITADDVELVKDTDYKVYYDEEQFLRITFVDDGIVPTKLKGHDLAIIKYETKFNREKLVLGTDIVNSAGVYYDSRYDDDGADEGEDPTMPPETDPDMSKGVTIAEDATVHTGGLKIKKVDDKRAPLAGAQFKICYTLEDARNDRFIKIDGKELLSTSGADGYFYFEGLPYGDPGLKNDEASTTYYVVEVKAPDGYNLLKEPVEVTVDKDSFTTNNPTVIQNKKGLVLPATGGIGTIIFLVTGGFLMVLGIYVGTRKEI